MATLIVTLKLSYSSSAAARERGRRRAGDSACADKWRASCSYWAAR